jgi:ABC-2 type transport system ATP-binding protein
VTHEAELIRRRLESGFKLNEGGPQLDAETRVGGRRVALSIEHLSKTYPIPFLRLKRFFRRPVKPPVEALRDVSFAVGEGEIFGLIGRNGAGKTTLTKIIATLVQPTTGTVTVRDYDSVRDEEKVRAQVGLASAEERSFYWRLTIEQNLFFFARLYGLSETRAAQRISELLSRFELEELSKRRFGELSTGNKQRMSVARALLASPPVLLLDEPTRSLDPVAAAKMRAFIASLARTTLPPVTVFLTSHNLAEVEELCARVAIINGGRIRALDTPKNLRALHRQSERVHLSIKHMTREEALRLLSHHLKDFDLSEELDQLLSLSFTRERGDDLLDAILRLIQDGGGAILSCVTEQPTLLDVLESYERDEEEGERT